MFLRCGVVRWRRYALTFEGLGQNGGWGEGPLGAAPRNEKELSSLFILPMCVLVSRGLAPKAVANEIGVTVNTIRSHLRKIYVKTNLGSYHQLARQLISQVEQQALHQNVHQLSA